ncbi:MAG: folate-binding protein [Methyloprofundus sp.]|nr:folate-binding protein [Methyloprofundus sp.]
MHPDWINSLKNLQLAATLKQDHPLFAPLTHLSILTVSGTDAAVFLQGQSTCDIKALVDNQPSLGAFCNAKGRTLSTFIIIKQAEQFLLILTKDLLATVQKKLQMYILRADVQLSDASDHLCLIGLHHYQLETPTQVYAYPQLANSHLWIGTPEEAIQLCHNLVQQGISGVDRNTWLALDIQAGIPWLFKATSEEFVPQMINLDKLNAISFEKGCYTGQEIVARTHYLGKNKRALYQASCVTDTDIILGCSISEAGEESKLLGTVVLTSKQETGSQLLVVLKDQAHEVKNLQLNNSNHDKISLN